MMTLADSRPGKPAAISLALVLHVLLLVALFRLSTSPIQLPTQREIELYLPAAKQHRAIEPTPHPLRPAALPTLRPQKSVTLEGLRGAIRQLSKLPPVPFSIPDITSALNCDDRLAQTHFGRQKPCIHPGWHYDAQDTRGFLLNEPIPEHKWTAAEINLYTMRTEDPCLVDRTAKLPFCVDQIISGPQTIPDPAKTPPSGLSLPGVSILGGH